MPTKKTKESSSEAILGKFECMRDWDIPRPIKIIGKGSKGQVYLVCRRKDNVRAAAKIERLRKKSDIEHFKKEVKNQIAFKGIAPKVYNSCVYKDKKSTWG